MNKQQTLKDKKILMVICGGIAAYKCLDLIRRLRERGADVQCILTNAAQKFITKLSVESLSNNAIASDLWEGESIAHIEMTRNADVIIVSPATANFIAKMANGIADDLASASVLAAKIPILIAPAMNPAMWNHNATARNIIRLKEDGVQCVGPVEGEMAEDNENGMGRLAEVDDIVESVEGICGNNRTLMGARALITAGATREAIDPVRYISNHSSGKQGYAIADKLAKAGAQVMLVHGNTNMTVPNNVKNINVDSAQQMKEAVQDNMPNDIAIFTAAVGDWKVKKINEQKMEKIGKEHKLELVANPDILESVGNKKRGRPKLVVGFAAQTMDKGGEKKMIEKAKEKRKRKGADWILANDVSIGTDTFGGDYNQIHFITENENEKWGRMTKKEVATKLVNKIAKKINQEIVQEIN